MSQLLEGLRRHRRIARAYRATGSRSWARLLERHGIDVREAPCEPQAGGLFFPGLGTIVPESTESVLLSGFQMAARLHAWGMTFDASREPVRATAGAVSVQVETTEELQILEEIYLDGAYHFALKGPSLILDVGMNTGYTALYLAATHPEAVICAYEPFAPTYRRAAANLALNPALASRIRAFPFGLSDSDRSMDIEYVDRWRGSVGVYGVPAKLRRPDEVRIERCGFHDAAAEIASRCDEYPDRRVVLKIDCEGSEYAILGRLADSAALERVDLMMIECHRRAPEHAPGALRALLSSRGFCCLHQHPDSADISMLYAVRAATFPRP